MQTRVPPRPLVGCSRLLHWLNAIAVVGLISSGWTIYNAAPFYAFTFPQWITLGGDLTQALRWHFVFIWCFGTATLALLIVRVLLRKGGPALIPVSAAAACRDLTEAVKLNLKHTPGRYIHLQRLLYLAAFALMAALILSGLALWKPVQFQATGDVFGGYEMMRRIHFWSMAGIAGFAVLHVAMVIVVPGTLLGMLFGARVVETCNEEFKTDG